MRKTIAIFSAIAVAAVACTKKSVTTDCYTCVETDSVVSNIPALSNPHFFTYTGTRCDISEAEKNFYEKVNTRMDTLYFSNDTIRQRYEKMNCEGDY
jgi:hypothetical protein